MFSSKAKQIGLAPGTLIHVGEQKTEHPELTIIDYDESHITRRDEVTVDDCLPFATLPLLAGSTFTAYTILS